MATYYRGTPRHVRRAEEQQRQAAKTRIDAAARKHLNISGAQFLRQYNAGVLPDTIETAQVEMLMGLMPERRR